MKLNPTLLTAYTAVIFMAIHSGYVTALLTINQASDLDQTFFPRSGNEPTHPDIGARLPRLRVGATTVLGQVIINGEVVHPNGFHREGFTIGGSGSSSSAASSRTSSPASSPRSSNSYDPTAHLAHSNSYDPTAHLAHQDSLSSLSSEDLAKYIRNIDVTSPVSDRSLGRQSRGFSRSPSHSPPLSPGILNRLFKEDHDEGVDHQHSPKGSPSRSPTRDHSTSRSHTPSPPRWKVHQAKWFEDLEPGQTAPLLDDNGEKIEGMEHSTVTKTKNGGRVYNQGIVIKGGSKNGPIRFGNVSIH